MASLTNLFQAEQGLQEAQANFDKVDVDAVEAIKVDLPLFN